MIKNYANLKIYCLKTNDYKKEFSIKVYFFLILYYR